jgi:hypothetical protein
MVAAPGGESVCQTSLIAFKGSSWAIKKLASRFSSAGMQKALIRCPGPWKDQQDAQIRR